jgi:D-3-phosphoglycerate dehydrogenase
LLAECDYVTLHVPQNDATKGMLNAEKFSVMKKGVRLLNFARGGLVQNKDLIRAIKDNIVANYVTDFPDEELLKTENVIAFPHLGASTPEAEDNCAIMAVKQLRNYLEDGNISNAVNFPDCEMERSANKYRMIIANKNIPNMVGQITAVLAMQKINIAELLNKHKNDIACNIIDTDSIVTSDLLKEILAVDGVIMARAL